MSSLENLRSTYRNPSPGSERRFNPRFGVPRCHVYSGGERMHLVNLGRSGMAIESFGRCNFSRSETHRFLLDDSINSIEVLGNVSWVSSSWVDDDQLPGTGLVQTVGVSFLEVLSPYRVGVWRSIESLVINPQSNEPLLAPLADSPAERSRPLVVMDRPHDGSVSTSRFISVEGSLQDSETVSRLKINGFEATIEGDQFSARVQLTRSVNYLCAVVSHWNKVDTACFLGKIIRESEESTPRHDSTETSPLNEALYNAAPDIVVLPELPNN